MKSFQLLTAALLLAAGAAPLRAQGVVVDEGRFAILIGGQRAGTEEFSIRRAGVGRDDAVFANATVSLVVEGKSEEIHPLLRAAPPDGIVQGYQIRITGDASLDIQMTRAGGRYVATIRSDVGQEDREFQARPDTRVLEAGIAHHYYFLRNLSEGETAHALEPSTRSHTVLTAGASIDEELEVGTRTVPARRVEFSAGADRRIVWYDRFGHVLRVDIPARDYVAERIDLVG
jgi:hypothetical protein